MNVRQQAALLALAAGLIFVVPADANVLYSRAVREVDVFYEIPPLFDSNGFYFGGFGDWSANASIVSPDGSAFASVSHFSTIGPSIISFTGATSATAHPQKKVAFLHADSFSGVFVSFVVTKPMRFEFHATWTTIGEGPSNPFNFSAVWLTHADTRLPTIHIPIHFSTTGEQFHEEVSMSGILVPGGYNFEAYLHTPAISGFDWGNEFVLQSASLELELRFIPSPHGLAIVTVAGVLGYRRRRR